MADGSLDDTAYYRFVPITSWVPSWGPASGAFSSLNQLPVPQGEVHHSQERALELLYHNMTDAQRQQYADHRYFESRGQRTKAVYRIYPETSINVAQMHNGKEKARYCLRIDDDVPLYDQMLTAKLLIETNEKKFLKTAKKHPPRGVWNSIQVLGIG